MKVLILSTGRGLRPESVQELRTTLALLDSDEMRLVSWQRSGSPLPVDRHLVVGPHLLAGRGQGQEQKVRQAALPPPSDGSSHLEEGADLPVDARLEQGAEPVASLVEPTTEAIVRVSETQALAKLPVWHPRRLRQAAAWRARRLKRAVSIRTRIRRHPLLRKVRNRLSASASVGFAASCLRAGAVHSLARDSDLVIALDTASHRGAWILAKRVSGPEVVIGVPAAQRLLDQRRPTPPASAS